MNITVSYSSIGGSEEEKTHGVERFIARYIQTYEEPSNRVKYPHLDPINGTKYHFVLHLGWNCCINVDKEYLLSLIESIAEMDDLSVLVALSRLGGKDASSKRG